MGTKMNSEPGNKPRVVLQERTRQDLASLINDMENRWAYQDDLGALAGESELKVLSTLEDELGNIRGSDVDSIITHVQKYFSWRRRRVVAAYELLHGHVGLANEYADPERAPADQFAQDNRGGFLQQKSTLLLENRNQFVAFAGGQFIASDTSFDGILDKLKHLPSSTDVYVEFVSESAFDNDAVVEMSGIHDIRGAEESLD